MICQKVERCDHKNDVFLLNCSFKNSMDSKIKSAQIKQDSYFSKLLLFNNNGEKLSSSN